MKSKILLFGLFLSLLMVSCSKDKETENSTITAEEAGANARIDIVNDDVSNIVDEQLTLQDGVSGRSVQVTTHFLPACATTIRVPLVEQRSGAYARWIWSSRSKRYDRIA